MGTFRGIFNGVIYDVDNHLTINRHLFLPSIDRQATHRDIMIFLHGGLGGTTPPEHVIHKFRIALQAHRPIFYPGNGKQIFCEID